MFYVFEKIGLIFLFILYLNYYFLVEKKNFKLNIVFKNNYV